MKRKYSISYSKVATPTKEDLLRDKLENLTSVAEAFRFEGTAQSKETVISSFIEALAIWKVLDDKKILFYLRSINRNNRQKRVLGQISTSKNRDLRQSG